MYVGHEFKLKRLDDIERLTGCPVAIMLLISEELEDGRLAGWSGLATGM